MAEDKDRHDKRESGQLGGGAGRKSEAGHTGVHPAGPAELKAQNSRTQGERGAAGNENRGGSELTADGGQLLGGLNTGPGDEPQRRSTEAQGDVEVAHNQWIAFLDSFSRQHLDWLVSVEVMSPIGRLIAIHERPLKGISVDSAGGKDRAYVQVGGSPEAHVSHTIDKPIRVTFKQSRTGTHQGLEIASSDGTTTAIRFRSAMSPEMLDGIAA